MKPLLSAEFFRRDFGDWELLRPLEFAREDTRLCSEGVARYLFIPRSAKRLCISLYAKRPRHPCVFVIENLYPAWESKCFYALPECGYLLFFNEIDTLIYAYAGQRKTLYATVEYE